MQVDIYQRMESRNRISYLVVPQGKPLPEEVTSTDWQATEHNIELDEDTSPLFNVAFDDALVQIGAKGYAITHLKDQ